MQNYFKGHFPCPPWDRLVVKQMESGEVILTMSFWTWIFGILPHWCQDTSTFWRTTNAVVAP